MGVETEVLRAIICCPLCWRNFCRSRSPDHIPLLPRVSREQVCLKAVSNHPSLFPMSYFIIFDEWALWSSCHQGRVIFELYEKYRELAQVLYLGCTSMCFEFVFSNKALPHECPETKALYSMTADCWTNLLICSCEL